MIHLIKGFAEIKQDNVSLLTFFQVPMDFLDKHSQLSFTGYLFERKPCLRSYRIWFESRCFTRLDATICLNILQSVHVRYMGL